MVHMQPEHASWFMHDLGTIHVIAIMVHVWLMHVTCMVIIRSVPVYASAMHVPCMAVPAHTWNMHAYSSPCMFHAWLFQSMHAYSSPCVFHAWLFQSMHAYSSPCMFHSWLLRVISVHACSMHGCSRLFITCMFQVLHFESGILLVLIELFECSSFTIDLPEFSCFPLFSHFTVHFPHFTVHFPHFYASVRVFVILLILITFESSSFTVHLPEFSCFSLFYASFRHFQSRFPPSLRLNPPTFTFYSPLSTFLCISSGFHYPAGFDHVV